MNLCTGAYCGVPKISMEMSNCPISEFVFDNLDFVRIQNDVQG